MSSDESSDDEHQMYDAVYGDSRAVEFMNVMHQLAQQGPAYMAKLEAESSRRQRRTTTRTWIPRNRQDANAMLMHHYFDEDHIYTDAQFQRRFRMTRRMFIQIVNGIQNFTQEPLPSHFRFFQSGPDACRRAPFTFHQRCTAALRQLAYGIPGDAADEYLQMGETTALECLDNFCKCVCQLFRNIYLRRPTAVDIQRLQTAHHEIHGLSGMLGSIDCMHWAWRRCPTAWRGQYTRGDHGHPTIMLEVVASYDLWIWHSFFGIAGSNNDLNVLQRSPLLNDLLTGSAPPSAFEVNGQHYDHGYYLADGIYPEWSTFVKSYSAPMDEKRRYFKRVQESARKDVERAFGMLQGRWQIIENPGRAWSVDKLTRIMYTCIILHNMIVEENGYAISSSLPYYTEPTNLQGRTFEELRQVRLENTQRLRQRENHHNLRVDLTDYVWNQRQQNMN